MQDYSTTERHFSTLQELSEAHPTISRKTTGVREGSKVGLNDCTVLMSSLREQGKTGKPGWPPTLPLSSLEF